MQPCSKKRLLAVLSVGGGLLLAGGLYALLCMRLGFGLPCLFHTVTGLDCPGCGVSRMLLSLLRLDFAGAWRANPVLLALLPVGAALGLRWAVRYIRTGGRRFTRAENAVLWSVCAVLLCFGILRNL